MKAAWDKEIEELTFNELLDWAVGVIVFGIAKGETMRELVRKILDTTLYWQTHKAKE